MARQSPEAVNENFRDVWCLLRDACTAFDNGAEYQAKQIATTIRTLVHQTASSHAVLEQLGHRRAWNWLDTSEEIDHTNLLMSFGLVSLSVSWPEGDGPSVSSYAPLLDGYPRVVTTRATAFSNLPVCRMRGDTVAFDYWWNNPVIRDLARQKYSRRQLVLALANYEGGTHVSPTVPAHYVHFSRGGTLSPPILESDGTLATNKASPVPAAVRQIAFEVTKTIEFYLPDLA